jgi:hypothetical protein
MPGEARVGSVADASRVRDDPSVMSERRAIRHEQMPDGRWLSWTDVEVFDGRGDVFSNRRELFTVNYKAIPDVEGERLLRQLD